MMMSVVLALLSASAAAASGYPMITVPPISDLAFQRQILDAHNAERRSVGEADLAWSPALAAEAQAWAQTIAAKGVMQHENQHRHGENIWMNGLGRYAPATMVQGWIAEKRVYKPGGAQPDISTTGNWADAGHYTAVVWSTTTAIGCGIGRGKTSDFLVCRYDPPGNVQGYAAYDVRVAERAKAGSSHPVTATAAPPASLPAKTAARHIVPVLVPSVSPSVPIPRPSPKPTVITKAA